MRAKSIGILAWAAFASLAISGVALADRAADLAKIDSTLKSNSLSAQAKGDLTAARAKAVDLLKAHDDKACSKVIMDATAKGSLKL